MRIAGERVGSDRTSSRCETRTRRRIVGTVPKATVDDLRRAFAIAKSYRADAHALRALRRSCYRTAELIRGRADAISDLITAESGLCKKDSTLRSRPRLRRVHVRRQRGAAGRRPGVLVRPDAARQVAQGVHAARAAAGRHFRDHAVQSSAEPGGAQGRAVDRDQQPDGVEADGENAAHRAAAGRHRCTRPACRRRCCRS